MITLLSSYLKQTGGAVAVTFGLTIPVILASVGLAVDMGQGYLVRQRLAASIDAAALAAAAGASSDVDEIEEIVTNYIAANYPDDRIGETTEVTVTLDEDDEILTVEATAMVDTAFMRLFGFDTLNVSTHTSVKREVRGLEVVMVLDVTGSMAPHMSSLREAAENFVEILFERADDPEDIKIGMVPFSNSVNVGPYGMGLDLEEDFYDDEFVIPPNSDIYDNYPTNYRYNWQYIYSGFGIDEDDLEYDRGARGQWHGCVIEDYDSDLDIEDHEGPWDMYRYDVNGSKNSYYSNVYDYSPYLTYGDIYNGLDGYGPNYQCPSQPIVPLTNDEDFLLDAIDDLRDGGNTMVNIGMVWGWRVISPDFPFTEGAPYDSLYWDKAVMLMTDGVNTMDGQYNALGRRDGHNMDAGDLDDKLTEICDGMKEDPQNILIYTVAFEDGVDEDTKDLLRDCASDGTKFFDAPDSDDLVDVFEQISRELSNLHITE